MVTFYPGVGKASQPAWNIGKTQSPTRSNARTGLGAESSGLQQFRLEISVTTVSITIEQGNSFTSLWPGLPGEAPAAASPQTQEAGAAADLFGEDGYFGVAKTAGRIAKFVLSGAGDDLQRLRAGREGILHGFREAEKAWGGTLPDISGQTIEEALKIIDDKIASLGETILDTTA